MIIIAIVVTLVAVAAIYALFDPTAPLFPRCFFRAATGFDCPGCGSQRALHALLNGHVADAARLNPLLLASFVAVPVYAVAEWSPSRWPRLSRALRSRTACLILAAVIILWWILRNIL